MPSPTGSEAAERKDCGKSKFQWLLSLVIGKTFEDCGDGVSDRKISSSVSEYKVLLE